LATDITAIMQHLNTFYDFGGKVIIHVGAGGGQFLEYARNAKKVMAVDNNAAAIEKLYESIHTMHLNHIYTVLQADYYEVDVKGDVLFFEFCLHEMVDPRKALEKGSAIAEDIVIIDHGLGSEWKYYTNEVEKIEKSWAASESIGIKKKETYSAVQFFNNYDELYKKVSSQGEISIARIKKFTDQTSITIPMTYTIALLRNVE
jgi:tRNA G37 N-methylase Trm5